MSATTVLLVDFLLGYALGSIPFGLLLTRYAGLGDVRNIGSGNIGATNVLRTGNKALAAATLLCDMLKGTVAVLIASRFVSNEWPLTTGTGPVIAGVGAVIGHMYPVWLKFKGGKGVATFLGVLLGIAWKAALGAALVWLVVAFASRYSSLAALLATAASPVILYFLGYPPVATLFLLIAVLVWWKHSENIHRLLAGNESKIGSKKKA
ncbi:MAG: glycerol-3-phosphate 1-O-acyltransferase PlsY [Rhizobiales bacterium]|jgi:glycerol-3-phosphate acyltransferase PlsY|nr:glycerol-3-phosphate 1-O-acyltransferase PlsY [Hyphomicrobiales bacterium]